jgi:hypothetical protein
MRMLGKPKLLSAAEMKKVLKNFHPTDVSREPEATENRIGNRTEAEINPSRNLETEEQQPFSPLGATALTR